jgi:HEAT repeat protein
MEQLSPQLMHKLVFTVLMHGLNDTQAETAYRLLTDAITHPNTQIRELAVVALADLTTPAPPRVAALTLALADRSARVRRRAARALGDFGAAAEPALPHLTAGLADRDASVRRNCAAVIGRLGPIAHGSAQRLIPLLTEPDMRSRAVAAVALRGIGPLAIPALLEGMRAESAEVRTACAAVLAKLTPAADPEACDFFAGPPTDIEELTWVDEVPVYDDGPPSGITPAPAGA